MGSVEVLLAKKPPSASMWFGLLGDLRLEAAVRTRLDDEPAAAQGLRCVWRRPMRASRAACSARSCDPTRGRRFNGLAVLGLACVSPRMVCRGWPAPRRFAPIMPAPRMPTRAAARSGTSPGRLWPDLTALRSKKKVLTMPYAPRAWSSRGRGRGSMRRAVSGQSARPDHGGEDGLARVSPRVFFRAWPATHQGSAILGSTWCRRAQPNLVVPRVSWRRWLAPHRRSTRWPARKSSARGTSHAPGRAGGLRLRLNSLPSSR